MESPSFFLNFHGVGPIPRRIGAGELDCWLDQDVFEAILDLVRESPRIGLTIDDGNESDFEVILPALLARNLSAAFFVCSDRLDQKTFLNRRQVQELRLHGMEVGSHGAEHRNWRHLSENELKREMHESRIVLEETCGSAVRAAACPFGSYDRRVLRSLRSAGYHSVYTSDGGAVRIADWLKPRFTIRRSMSFDHIESAVRNYNRPLQRWGKWALTLIKRTR